MVKQKSNRPGTTNLTSMKKSLFILIIIFILICLIEIIGWIGIKIYPKYEIARQILFGNEDSHIVHQQNSISQAYLLYIPAPNYSNHGIIQHNEQGYRGSSVPLQRTKRKLRILFLGGSTTYGWSVKSPDETYPALVGRILEQKLKRKYDGIEIINGGLMFGTTAEIMTHYLFKYRYYKPDIVVINTGGNDAGSSSMLLYHPDYSHWRHSLPRIFPIHAKMRWIMHSRFIAFLAIRIFYIDMVNGVLFAKVHSPLAKWYTNKPIWYNGRKVVSEDNLAFKRNLSTIIREIKADGSEVLLVAFRVNPNESFPENFNFEIARNEIILKKMALDFSVTMAPFPADIISPENWTDRCHLNAAGCQQKALHVVKYLLPVIGHEMQ